MQFEWDEAKRNSNLSKHGVDFLRMQMLFDERPVITAASPDRTKNASPQPA
jgi:uncharacterized DUF497 family protein